MTIQIEVNNEGMYVTKENLVFRNIVVPKGFIFDGVTVKAPFTLLFSNKDLRQGVLASCVHDYMCRNKDKWDRNYATRTLVSLWILDGLSPIKGAIVYI